MTELIAKLQYSDDHQHTWHDAGPRAYWTEGATHTSSSHYPASGFLHQPATDWRVLIVELDKEGQQ